MNGLRPSPCTRLSGAIPPKAVHEIAAQPRPTPPAQRSTSTSRRLATRCCARPMCSSCNHGHTAGWIRSWISSFGCCSAPNRTRHPPHLAAQRSPSAAGSYRLGRSAARRARAAGCGRQEHRARRASTACQRRASRRRDANPAPPRSPRTGALLLGPPCTSASNKHGSLYTDLRRCAVIWITNFNELVGQRFHSIFGLREVRDAALLTHHLELHLVELPKLRDALDRNDEPTLAAWGKFLTADSRRGPRNPGHGKPRAQASERTPSTASAPTRRLGYEPKQREMALFSYELGLSRAHRDGVEKGLEQGIEQGVEKGLEQGRVQGKAEFLQRQLTLKFGAVPPDVAGRVASATDEELAKWAERVLSATTLEGVFEA